MYRKSCAPIPLTGSDLTLEPALKVECGYHSVCHASTMSRPGIHCVKTQCLVFMGFFFPFFTPQPLRAVGVLFSPVVSGWAGWWASGKSLSGLYLRNRKV